MQTLQEPENRLYTADELLHMPSDWHYELICGELRKMTPPGCQHGDTASLFSVYVGAYVLEHGLGRFFAAETGFLLTRNPDTVLAPDFAFVRKERLPAQLPVGYLALAPDLVLETRSPSDSQRKAKEKAEEWLRAGVRMVVDLNPKAHVLTIYRPDVAPLVLDVDSTFSGEDVLPGFVLTIRKLFPDAE